MYGQNVSNVTAAKPKTGGAVWRAPLGTTLPTSPSETLDAAFVGLGFISEDGLTHSNSPSTENVKAWGKEIVYTYSSERPETYAATFIESMNTEVLKMVYGDDNVSVDATTGVVTINHTADELDEAVYVIDTVLRDGALKRIVIPDGKPSEIGEDTYSDSGLLGYEITISCIVDSNGGTSYEYIQPAS